MDRKYQLKFKTPAEVRCTSAAYGRVRLHQSTVVFTELASEVDGKLSELAYLRYLLGLVMIRLGYDFPVEDDDVPLRLPLSLLEVVVVEYFVEARDPGVYPGLFKDLPNGGFLEGLAVLDLAARRSPVSLLDAG
jgi:hypothetical protein